ncbi:MAG: LysR family transcriptional regulator [Proteobacteria bacterium]|nr:LysR family transcriptional regulator [Pseudomonadota bacterium]
MDGIGDIRTFIAVADARSFAAAARKLAISPAQASKLVARLEDRLGARLLNRTTRDVSLTDVGRAYLDRARALVDEFDALETSVRDTAKGPRGLLKVSAPVSFGALQLQPALLDFAAAYPDLGLEVFYADRAVNLVDEGFDAAVRIGHLSDSSLVARRLAVTRVVTCASPAYLAHRGAPERPSDLSSHDVVLDLNLRDPSHWPFVENGRRIDVRVQGRLRFSRAEACLAAAREGWGIAREPAFVAAEDLRAGRLKLVLPAFEPQPLPIHAVYPHARHLAAKVRVFVDFLAERFAGEPEWHRGW